MKVVVAVGTCFVANYDGRRCWCCYLSHWLYCGGLDDYDGWLDGDDGGLASYAVVVVVGVAVVAGFGGAAGDAAVAEYVAGIGYGGVYSYGVKLGDDGGDGRH